MADKGLQIRATVNTPENAKSIDEQIIALSNKIKSKISVKLNIDSKDISFLTTEVNKLKNQVSKSLNVEMNTMSVNSNLNKVSQKFEAIAGQSQKMTEEITEFTNSAGQTVKIIDKLDTETGNVSKTLTTVSDNFEKARKEAEKLAEAMAKVREKSELSATKRESNVQLANANATNKALDEQYKKRQDYVAFWEKALKSQDIKAEANSLKEQQRANNYITWWERALKQREIKEESLSLKQSNLNTQNQSKMWTERSKEAVKGLTQENTELKKMRTYYIELEKSANKLVNLQRTMFGTDGIKGEIDLFKTQHKSTYNKNKAAFDEFEKGLRGLSMNSDDLDNKMKKATITMSLFKQQAKQSSNVLSNALVNAGKFLRFYLVGGALVSVVNVFRNGIENVKDLDEAITNMSITMNLTTSDFDKMTSSAQKLAKELGSSVKDVLQAAKTFANMNESIDAILEKTRANIMLSNLSGSGIEQTTDSMQGIKEQFELLEKDSMRIADTLTFISANLAMDFSKGINEITDGIKVSGSMAREAGFELERYESVIGSVIERTRLGGSTVSNAAKTIFARLGRVNDPDLASDEDISKTEEAYRSIGIALRDVNGQFREIPKVLDELNDKWTTLTSTQKSYIAEQSAGVRQKNIFINMVESWTRSTELYTQALDANGFATERNTIFMESIQGRIKQFTATSEIFWQDFISTDLIKNFISALDGLVGIIDTLVNNSFTSFILTIGLTTTAFHFLSIGLTALKGSYIATSIGVFALDVAEKGLITTTKALTTSLLTSPLFWVTGATAIIYGIVTAVDYLNKSFERQKTLVDELTTEYTDLDNQLNELKGIENRTEAQELYLQLLEKELKTKQQILAIEKQKLFDKEFYDRKLFDTDKVVSEATKPLGEFSAERNRYLYATVEGGKNLNLYEQTANRINLLIDLQKKYNDLVKKSQIAELNEEEAKSFEEYENAINLLENALSKTSIKIKDYKNDNVEVGVSIINLEKNIDLLLNIIEDVPKKSSLSKLAQQELISLDSLNEEYEKSTKAAEEYSKAIDTMQSSVSEINSVIDNMNEGTELSGNQIIDLIQKYPELISSLERTKNGYKINTDALKQLRIAQIDELNIAKQAAIDKKVAVLESISKIVEGYGIQIRAINSLADAESQLSKSKIGLYGLDVKDFNLEEGLYQEKSLTEYWGLSDVGKETLLTKVNIAKTTLEIGKLKDEAKALANITSDPNFFTTFDEPKDNTKEKKQLSQYFNQLEEIARLENELSVIRSKSELNGTSSSKEQLALIDKIQDKMHQLNNARRKEKDSIERQLKTLSPASEKYVELKERLSDLNKEIESASLSWLDYEKQQKDLIKTAEEVKQEAFIKIEELVKKAIEDRNELERNALDDKLERDKEDIESEKKKYESRYNVVKNALQREKELIDKNFDEAKYKKELDDKNKELIKLQLSYDKIALANGGLILKDKIKLEEEIAEKREEIAEFIKEHEISVQKDGLDEQLRILEDEKDREERIRENKLDKLERDYKAAYSKLEKDTEEYTKSIAIETTNILMSSQSNILNFLISNLNDYKNAGASQAQAYINGYKEVLNNAGISNSSNLYANDKTKVSKLVYDSVAEIVNQKGIYVSAKSNNDKQTMDKAVNTAKPLYNNLSSDMAKSLSAMGLADAQNFLRGLVSYDTGGVIVNAHEKERVLTPKQNINFEKLINLLDSKWINPILPNFQSYLPKIIPNNSTAVGGNITVGKIEVSVKELIKDSDFVGLANKIEEKLLGINKFRTPSMVQRY